VRQVRILEAAVQEAEAAAAWYEKGRVGLGAEFAAAIDAALDLIEEGVVPLSPLPGTAGAEGARRLILRRFPYDMVVIDREDQRIIVALAHHARKPGYWQGRIRRLSP
jgi:toxin ParE1/3/4